MAADRRFIPLHRPDLGEAETEAAVRVIRSGWVSQGAEVEAFERAFAAYVDAPYAIAVSSGTVAVELALRALGIMPGDEVVTASHSFIAGANAIRAVGARPLFVDIDPATLNLDPGRIVPAITPATRAILAVHQVGMPCDLAALVELARVHRLALIEDAACALGSEIRWDGQWQRIGRPQGDIACFSLHGRKVITTGEGGMIVTRDPKLDRVVRLLRNHGMSTSAHARHAAMAVTFENYEISGFSYRLSDIAAAIGREQLKRLPTMVEHRRILAARYSEMLLGTTIATPITEPEWARSNWQSFPVRLAAGLDQCTVMQRMLDEGIATRRGIMCAHLEPAWPKKWSCAGRGGCTCSGAHCDALIESERARDACILLPLYSMLERAEQERVVAALRRACARSR